MSQDDQGLPALGALREGAAGAEAVFEALELAVRRRLPGRLQGDRRGLRLGPGTEPEEVVRYRPGEDDVRRIDWNVTARVGEPHVWRPQAEHELETWVLVDDTASMAFGTQLLEKRDLAAGAIAAIGLLTSGPGNRVGVERLTPDGLQHTAPLPARVAAHRALRLSPARPGLGSGSVDLAAAIGQLAARHRRPGLRVVVTDFLDAEGSTERPFAWERPLRRLAAGHETLVVEVLDPRELALPDVGSLTLRDPESGRSVDVDTHDPRLRTAYAGAAAAHRTAVGAAVRAARAGHVVLRTDRDWVRDLARHVIGGPLRHGSWTGPERVGQR